MDRRLLAAVAIVTTALLTSSAAGYPYRWPMCGTTGNLFGANSTYQANLNLVASSLPINTSTSPSLYATAVVGAVPEQVWAMALCRGDVNSTVCFSCLAQAFDGVQDACPGYKNATIYYDTCTLHYSDVYSFSGDVTGPLTDSFGELDIGNAISDLFNRLVTTLINATADYAALTSMQRFAIGEADFNLEFPFPKVYSLAQCVPDQTPAQCRKCLAEIIADFLPSILGNMGGRVLFVNCTFRYDTAPFFHGPAMVRLGNPSPSSGAQSDDEMPASRWPGEGRRSRNKIFIISLVASITVLCAMLVVVCIMPLRKGAGTGRQRSQNCSEMHDEWKLWRMEDKSTAFTLYDLSKLADVTGGFSEQNRLGRGGFGPVYKGKLGDGTEIAVKRMAAESVQGLVELMNEIQLIAKLQHKNLVRLVGCCLEQEEKMLVYEYMPNGSLDFFIFNPLRGQLLDWKKRFDIIDGIVQGLIYLHKLSRVRIIHRDLKASNILLDKDLNPKISDFGVARILSTNNTQANTNRVVGTYGYMAPEYASEGIFSARSDVFSFGVLLLEILSGKMNNSHHHYGDFVNLLGYAWQLWSEGREDELIDPTLGECCDKTCITRCMKVALLCVQEDAMDRPTMIEVAMMLGSDRAVVKDPKQPPHFHLRLKPLNSQDGGGVDRLQFNGRFSTHDMTITQMEEGR